VSRRSAAGLGEGLEVRVRELANDTRIGDVPDLDMPVAAATSQKLAVGAERDAEDPVPVALVGLLFLVCLELPYQVPRGGVP
jgi:hypothetical protein